MKTAVGIYHLTPSEIELLLGFEHGGWGAAPLESGQDSVAGLIRMGLLSQDSPYTRITRPGIEAVKALRDGF